MVFQGQSRDYPPRSGMFFSSGVRLAVGGSLVIGTYYFLVSQSPLEDLRDTLAWAIPAGVICWIVAVGFFAAGVVALNAESMPVKAGPLSRDGEKAAANDWRRRAFVLFGTRLGRFRLGTRPRWSLAWIRALDEKALIALAAGYFREIGFRPATARETVFGVDIWLHSAGETEPVGAVRCLCRNRLVEVGEVRAFERLLEMGGIPNGAIVTTGEFSADAAAFAQGRRVELIPARLLYEKLEELPPERSEQLLREARLMP